MLIAVLLFSETTVAKLAAHAITPEEVRQANDGDRVAIANPRPRVGSSVLMIAPTHGGRILTVLLNPRPSIRALGMCAPRGRQVLRRAVATAAIDR